MYMNTDLNTGTYTFLSKLNEQKKITPDMLYPFVDVHRHTQVTDIVMNVCAGSSNTLSDVYLDYADFFECEVECVSDALSQKRLARQGLYDLQKKHGIDAYATWIDRCRQVGFRPWISFRMNDCHTDEKEPINSPKDFNAIAADNGWELGKEYLYYAHCYDYTVPEVRAHFLDYIREQAARYDVYGIELDFLREYHCFKYLTADMDECREIMTQFMRDVKAIILDCEKIHGHKMKIMIRLPRDIEHCLYYGFDPVKMAKEGLVDVVVTSPRFSGSDTGINVDEWRAALPGVEIVPGIEAALGIIDGRFVDTSKEVALGIAANYLSYDPDGLYFFNHIISPRAFSSFFSSYSEYEELIDAAHEPFPRNFTTLACAADYKTIHQSAVRFVIIPEGYESCAGYPRMWRPIPTELSSEAKSFEIRTGLVPKGKKCSVILGFYCGVGAFRAKLNGEALTDFERTDISFIEGIGYQPKISQSTACYRARFDESLLTSPVQTIEIVADNNSPILTWVEINVY